MSNVANNVCIQKIEIFDCGGTATKYIVVCRYNYTPLDSMESGNAEKSEFYSLDEAVQSGRKISKAKNLPLCCSCSLLNRPETAGLKMF